MRFPFKAIAIGLLVGAVLFFAPFRLPFFIFFLVFFLFSRFFFWGGRRRGMYGPPWHYGDRDYSHEITPIDGYAHIARPAKGSERKITIY